MNNTFTVTYMQSYSLSTNMFFKYISTMYICTLSPFYKETKPGRRQVTFPGHTKLLYGSKSALLCPLTPEQAHYRQ